MEERIQLDQQAGSGKRYVSLTDLDARRMLEATECPACHGAKFTRRALCATDFLALPLYLRNWLTDVKSPYFTENLRRALQHLADFGAQRQMRILTDGRRWSYRTAEELAAAGYVWRDHARCKAPGCRAWIEWYRRPEGGMIPVNLADYQPHPVTCRDPQYFERRRALRASAKPRRRRA